MDWQAGGSIGSTTKTFGGAAGARTSISRPAKAVPWCLANGIKFFAHRRWAERRPACRRTRELRAAIPCGLGHRTGVVEPFVNSALDAAKRGLVTFYHRHRVDELVISGGRATGVRARCLPLTTGTAVFGPIGNVLGDFELSAQAVIVTTGGSAVTTRSFDSIGRSGWVVHLVDDHRRTRLCRRADARHRRGIRCSPGESRPDVHYTEGVQTGIPSGPGMPSVSRPDRRRCGSTLWASGSRSRICRGTTHSRHAALLRTTPEISGYDHSWFILTQKIIEREFALSGSEQNPDITSKDRGAVLEGTHHEQGAPAPVEAFKKHGADFVVADTPPEELVKKMND